MAELFSTKIWDHARNPRNLGFLTDADVLVQAGDPSQGDAFLFLFKIRDEQIEAARFLAKGNPAAVAASSVATELAVGKSLDEVLAIGSAAIAGALGGMPEEKMYCCRMAATALHTAVHQYRSSEEDPVFCFATGA